MSAEWVTAIGTVGTFVVIAASAVAALIQLRHMGRSNQIASFDELRDAMESADFRAALDFIRSELPKYLHDPSFAERVRSAGISGEIASVRFAGNVFESMGLFVRNGMVDPDIACELWAHVVFQTWQGLAPITALVRVHYSSAIWVNFEYMAVISKRYIDAHPLGMYPAGLERMPVDRSLLDQLEGPGAVKNSATPG